MSQPNYTLEVISHHVSFKNKSLKKYYVDGIETVGAWGDEPFEIRFRNNTWQKVQVKLSLDGTDILTGEKASTDVTKDMWIVNGYGTLNLKAWPETSNGGAQFVFTSAEQSVAVNTHGDLSNRGIIAVAVYTEGHIEPIRINPIIVQPYYPRTPYFYEYNHSTCDDRFSRGIGSNTISTAELNGSGTDSISFNACDVAPTAAGADCLRGMASSKSLESLVSVGAGQHVDQKISYVAGLIKPVLTQTVRVRYLWWDDLVAKLKENNVPAPHASGFPADRNEKIMSIGKTPRIGNNEKASSKQTTASYLRV